MHEFTTRFADDVTGVLHGWDRMLFRGTLRTIAYVEGLSKCLSFRRVLLKDFDDFAKRCTALLDDNARRIAQQAARPFRYLESPAVSKEDLALKIAKEDGITNGLICVLSCVEPCQSYEIRRDSQRKLKVLVSARRKCRHFYFYYLDEQFGLIHVRLQSWLPCDVQVCVNGRSYLQRQLDRVGIAYEKAENCFRRIADLPRAQELMDQMTSLNFSAWLAKRVAPIIRPLLRRGGPLHGMQSYYWTIRQSEYATDVMFGNATMLAGVYPGLCRHAIDALGSQEILRFLGRRHACEREVASDLQRRIEGVRVKHRLGNNSIKMYDKQGTVLRIETTINDPAMFRVLRKAQRQGASKLAWRQMRKAVADIARRARVGHDANTRYLTAIAAVRIPHTTAEVLDPVSVPLTRGDRNTRALRPIDPLDAALLAAVYQGEHMIRGFTNRQVREQLFPQPTQDPRERLRRCSAVSRKLRLLRNHRLIQKVGNSRLYRIAPKGHAVMTLSAALRSADYQQLRVA